jgi:hypothetical protein
MRTMWHTWTRSLSRIRRSRNQSPRCIILQGTPRFWGWTARTSTIRRSWNNCLPSQPRLMALLA